MLDLRPDRLPVLSGWTIRRLSAATDGPLTGSLDLGRSRCTLVRSGSLVRFPDGSQVNLHGLIAQAPRPEDCVQITPEGPQRLYLFDETTNSSYKLHQPVEDRAPTLLINGVAMHAIADGDPWADQRRKVHSLGQITGRCLDTCCGLGYSAQLLLEAGGASVVTCERESCVLRLAAANPWSEGLFCDPRVRLEWADVREVLAETGPGEFDCVFHDPPTVALAGELYSLEFMQALRRVLKPGGLLYHYVGEPGVRSGRDLASGVVRRLKQAGFSHVRRAHRGVAAVR